MTLLDNAKRLRREMTEAEKKLWYQLRGHRFLGLKFKRQKPVGPYIVDFICTERWLVIELDGGQHQQQNEADQIRDLYLQSRGYRVLRFWNHEALAEIEAVLEQIRQAIHPAQ